MVTCSAKTVVREKLEKQLNYAASRIKYFTVKFSLNHVNLEKHALKLLYNVDKRNLYTKLNFKNRKGQRDLKSWLRIATWDANEVLIFSWKGESQTDIPIHKSFFKKICSCKSLNVVYAHLGIENIFKSSYWSIPNCLPSLIRSPISLNRYAYPP